MNVQNVAVKLTLTITHKGTHNESIMKEKDTSTKTSATCEKHGKTTDKNKKFEKRLKFQSDPILKIGLYGFGSVLAHHEPLTTTTTFYFCRKWLFFYFKCSHLICYLSIINFCLKQILNIICCFTIW